MAERVGQLRYYLHYLTDNTCVARHNDDSQSLKKLFAEKMRRDWASARSFRTSQLVLFYGEHYALLSIELDRFYSDSSLIACPG